MKQLLLLFSCFITLFAFGQSGTVEGVVSDSSGPLPFVNIIIEGSNIGTVTDISGAYSISLAEGDRVLMASYIGYRVNKQLVNVQANETVQANFSMEEGLKIDEVVVLGSRSNPRTNLESAVPVDVINAQQLKNSSHYNVSQTLQYIAPSFHSTQQTISDGTDHVDPATLRGLGPDQTLVLVNGKRRHTSALLNVNGTVGRGTVGTDLNSIPASAIKKIEILRDGAAAQYGSDAIAGVVNIVLKDNTDRATIDVQIGTALPNILGGPDAGNVPEEMIPEFDNDSEMIQVATNFGFDLGKNGGFVNVTGEFTEKQATNRSGNYTGSIYPANYANALSDDDFFNQVQDETEFVEQQVMQIGGSKLRNGGAVINAEFPLRNAELYSTLGFNVRSGIARGFYRFPGSQDRVIPQLYPHGFSPEIHSDIDDKSMILGVRGDIGKWKADLSNTQGSNSFDFTIKNSNNASLGQSSPTSAYAGGFSYGQNTTNVDFSRGLDFNFPTNVALGAEFRVEDYQIFEGESASYINGGMSNSWDLNDGTAEDVAGAAGIQVFPGFQPQNALNKSRNSIGLYTDWEFDFTDELLIAVAGRYENYSDFGDEFTWKLAGRYKVSDDFAVRTSVSTGFRAPSLHQVYFNNLSTQFVSDPISGEQIPVQVGTFNNESSVTKAFGIDPLKAETSTNFSVGITSRLLDNLSISVDGYMINIDDRIVLSGRFDADVVLANGQLAGDILTPLGAGSAQFFTNAISTETKGLDIVTTYRTDLGNGKLNLSLAGNLTETEVVKNSNGDADITLSDDASVLLDGLESTLFNREEISRLEVAQPNSKFSLSAEYKINKLGIMLRATRFGEITYIHPSDGGDPSSFAENSFTGELETRDQVFDAKIVPDIELSYEFSKNFTWRIGAQNFTNTYPDLHQHSGNNSSGRFLFSRRVQQFGVRGFFAYTKLSFTIL